VSPRATLIACIAALAALAIQQRLVPFMADSQMGLFTNGGDLAIYRQGGLQILHGQSLYTEPLPPGGWFTYPPFAAVVFMPFTMAGFSEAKTIWMLVSFAALASVIWRCATTLGYRPNRQLAVLSVALAVLAADIEAVRGSLWQGQINIALMAVIVWDLTGRRESRVRGWSVGIAAGMKLTAVVFVPYLLITRQWRAAIVATTTAAATATVTWVVRPTDSALYWSHAVFQTDRIGPLDHPGNFSIAGILATLWAPNAMPIILWLAIIGVTALLGYYAACRADRAGNQLLAVTLIGMLSCTVPPLAWGHHWVWTVPLLLILLDQVIRQSSHMRWAWVTMAAATYLLVFMWFSTVLYRGSQRFDAGYASYVEAFDAAISHLSRLDKLLFVAPHPVLFVVTAVSTILFTGRRNDSRRPQSSGISPW
jgi:alpha-1,2-mannosyltransferase